MAPNYTALATQWATYSAGMTTSQKLQAVNSLQVTGEPVDVKRTDIIAILNNSGALATLRNYAASPPQGAASAVIQAANYVIAIVDYEATYMPTLETSNPTYLAAIQNMMPNLLTAGVSQDVVNQLNALISPQALWWSMNGFSAPVNIFDLIQAGNLY